jgi:hypothetical protein
MNDQEYDYVLRIAVEEAQAIDKPADPGDLSAWDRWHDEHFGRVLEAVDSGHYSYLEAADISEVCSEVEGDIRHGDILGI